jgi:type VI secretion system secreted protein VgrG
MSTAYIQAERPIAVSTPLAKDDLLLVGFEGREAVSELFHFHLDLIAENSKTIPFEKLLGQKITFRLTIAPGKWRYFSGICQRVLQGTRDNTFTAYHMEVVPLFWLLTRKTQSRIFQQISVPEILKQVLQGLDVTYNLQGNFAPRDYCVQYRESDFDFASRLMEEEGIAYYFTHTANGHTLVLTNTTRDHPALPERSNLRFAATDKDAEAEDQIEYWEKSQELRSGHYTLWDHCFELPHKHLEADQTIAENIKIGQVTHPLKVGNNDKLEIYDFPGRYAQRFDGVAPGGADRSADLQHIFDDNKRTVGIRMQEEAAAGIVIQGSSRCRFLISGHAFNLQNHYNADGKYLLTAVEHKARLDFNYRSGGLEPFAYSNAFTCIPADLPYRPLRKTPRPVVQGTQTAVVVGPPGEEIFTDKYSRVKVQFHWDRQGKNNLNSSCWIRVATFWAGAQWGAIHIPRIGQEVVVDFEEGDPDRPIIIGSVYNAAMMPPYKLPESKTQSGIKSRSTLNGTPGNYNEFRFEDKSGVEQILLHAERNLDTEVEVDESLTVGNNRSKSVGQDETIKIGAGRTATVQQNDTLTVSQGNRNVSINMGNDSLTIAMGNQTTKINLGSSQTEAMQSIELKVGQSSIKIDQTGVTIQGMMISVQGQIQTQIQGTMTQVSGSAMLQMQGGLTMIN